MAQFEPALALVLKNEGGYVNDPNDRGGQTYKGVARKMNSTWSGWTIVDARSKQAGFPKNLDADAELAEAIAQFYKSRYWDPLRADQYTSQHIADSIFDFGVNAGPATAVKLSQIVLKLPVTGSVDQTLVDAINAQDEKEFLAMYALAKIGRYVDICKKRSSNKIYFFGWVNRVLEGL